MYSRRSRPTTTLRLLLALSLLVAVVPASAAAAGTLTPEKRVMTSKDVPTLGGPATKGAAYRTGEVLVRFDEGIATAARMSAHAAAGTMYEKSFHIVSGSIW